MGTISSSEKRRASRRGLVAGLIAGVIVATVVGAYAKTAFKQMVKGAPAKAADVNTAHQDLADAIDTLAAEVAKLKAAPDCPPGYTRDTSAKKITWCKRGADEVVKVGTYWVDRYEASLVDDKVWSGGLCSGTGVQYGGATLKNDCSKDYPAGFPCSGNWTKQLYACSRAGAMPSRAMTWFQAQQACLLAGKRLCTNVEWQGAVVGTVDPGAYNGAAGGPCHTNGTLPRKAGLAGTAPGASSSCISAWGAADMIGNLHEWVDLWGQVGADWSSASSWTVTAWPSGAGYGDGKDKSRGFNGSAGLASGAQIKGLPSAAIRGGYWKDGDGAGAFAVNVTNAPANAWESIGVRCCMD